MTELGLMDAIALFILIEFALIALNYAVGIATGRSVVDRIAQDLKAVTGSGKR